MNRIRLYIFGLSLFFLMASCRENCKVQGINVTEILVLDARDQSIDYCHLLENALANDIDSIIKLTLFDPTGGASSYDHGTILVELIDSIGESDYIKIISKIDKEHFPKVQYTIMAGLEYGNNKNWKGKPLSVAFPKLAKFLSRP